MAKSRKHLRDFLDATQRRQLDKFGYFDFISSEGHRYRIHTETYSGNVMWVDAPGNSRTYCAHIDIRSHLRGRDFKKFCEQNAIAQMLLIQTSERSFWAIANRNT